MSSQSVDFMFNNEDRSRNERLIENSCTFIVEPIVTKR